MDKKVAHRSGLLLNCWRSGLLNSYSYRGFIISYIWSTSV